MVGLGPSHNRFGKSILVGASTGDELIESGKLPAPDLIKIDVEGFEIEVLTGLERHLRASQNVAVVFEHCLYRFRERQMSLDAPTKYLAELGFSFKVVEESGGLRPLSPGDLQRDLDFVATK